MSSELEVYGRVLLLFESTSSVALIDEIELDVGDWGAKETGVTVNGFEAELSPWVTTTDLDPSDDEGTVKIAENPPLLLGVTVAGFVVTRFSSKCMVTIELRIKIGTCDSYRVTNGSRGWIKYDGRRLGRCHCKWL